MSRHFRGSLQVFQKDNLEFFLNKNEETGGTRGVKYRTEILGAMLRLKSGFFIPKV